MASSTVPLISEESVAIETVQDEEIVEQTAEQIEEEPLPEPIAVDEPLPSELQTEVAPSQLELLPPSEDNSLDSTYGFEESEAEADDAIS